MELTVAGQGLNGSRTVSFRAGPGWEEERAPFGVGVGRSRAIVVPSFPRNIAGVTDQAYSSWLRRLVEPPHPRRLVEPSHPRRLVELSRCAVQAPGTPDPDLRAEHISA